MTDVRSKVLRALGATLVLATLALAVAALAGAFEGKPEGPAPIAWDHETCAECHMHIGDPSYAAQIRTADDRVASFDDPGCLFRYLEREAPEVHAMYFHHSEEDRWLTRDQVAFLPVPGDRTPMSYGLAAVDSGTPGAVGFEAAYRRVTNEELHADGGEQ